MVCTGAALSLRSGCKVGVAGVCPNKGCFGTLLTHFVKLRFTSFNFYSLFLKLLRGSELQFIASLMRRKFRKKLAPLFFFMSEHKSFCAKRKKLLGSIIGGTNYPKGAYGADWRKPTKPTRAKDVRLLLFLGLPLARQRWERSNKRCFWKLLTHSADGMSASFNFNTQFLKLLRGSELQFIVAYTGEMP